jgi:hypothetical protein
MRLRSGNMDNPRMIPLAIVQMSNLYPSERLRTGPITIPMSAPFTDDAPRSIAGNMPVRKSPFAQKEQCWDQAGHP